MCVQNADRFWQPLKYIRPLGPLFVCIVGIVAVYIGQVDTPDRGAISIVGSIPSGMLAVLCICLVLQLKLLKSGSAALKLLLEAPRCCCLPPAHRSASLHRWPVDSHDWPYLF